MNDINKSNWKTYSDIADTLWSFSRDADSKKDKFQGAFIYQVAHSLIVRYTKKGDLVLDPFGGTGTTGRAARKLKRRCVLSDIRYPNGTRRQKGVWVVGADVSYKDYAEKIVEEFGIADLVILHPPYYDVIQFTESEFDLSNAYYDDFYRLMRLVWSNAFNCVKVGGYVALVMGDVYGKGKGMRRTTGRLWPAHHIADIGSQVGLVPVAIFIKNIVGNEAGKGKDTNLWRYRALQHGFAVFKHEYIFVFRREE